MDNLRTLVRSCIRESFPDRPYGIAYTGAMIEDASDCEALRSAAELEMEKMGGSYEGWSQPSDYHMTICLGELPLHMKMRGDLNAEISLRVTHFGVSERAAAFKVEGFMSKNDLQHITMLFRDRPADSKEIDHWVALDEPFSVAAVIREIPALKP